MTHADPQSTLRQWRRIMSAPLTLVSMGGAAVLLALAAPFDTGDLLGLVPRTLYWATLVGLCYGWGLLVNLWTEERLAQRSLMLRILVSGMICGAGVLVAVMGMNLVVFGWWPQGGQRIEFTATVLAISLIVNGFFALLHSRTSNDDSPAADPPKAPHIPPLMDRLPLEQRGALIALSVEDHYVRVRTARGEALILMRLSDAIREVGSTSGAQVHRSHWAAFDQVRAVRREGDRAILTMKDGSEIPASRANIPKLKEAGLLPR